MHYSLQIPNLACLIYSLQNLVASIDQRWQSKHLMRWAFDLVQWWFLYAVEIIVASIINKVWQPLINGIMKHMFAWTKHLNILLISARVFREKEVFIRQSKKTWIPTSHDFYYATLFSKLLICLYIYVYYVLNENFTLNSSSDVLYGESDAEQLGELSVIDVLFRKR